MLNVIKNSSFMMQRADVPPVGISLNIQSGFDLITFSGGKRFRGPQTQDCYWKKDLIEAAKIEHSPHEAPLVGQISK